MRIPRRDKERSKRLTPKRKRISGASSPEFLGMTLNSIAPQIEAAGNFDRAIRLGLFGAFGDADLKIIKGLVPLSRGGTLAHADADRDWSALVQGAVEARDVDMERLRSMCAELDKPAEPDAGNIGRGADTGDVTNKD